MNEASINKRLNQYNSVKEVLSKEVIDPIIQLVSNQSENALQKYKVWPQIPEITGFLPADDKLIEFITHQEHNYKLSTLENCEIIIY